MVALAAVCAPLAAAGPAGGASPGENGLIAFASGRGGGPDQLHVVRPDGTAVTRLLASDTADNAPAWSPDGTRVAIARTVPGVPGTHIWVVDADGTGPVRLTTGTGEDTHPTWSPDGARIAFQSDRGRPSGYFDIHVVGADGTGRTPLTSGGAGPLSDTGPSWSATGRIAFSRVDTAQPGEGRLHVMAGDGGGLMPVPGPATGVDPDWSPDGTRLAFMDRAAPADDYDIHVIAADGTGRARLTTDPGRDSGPAWSPDGSLIAFASSRGSDEDLYVMAADGSGQTPLAPADGFDQHPAWQPLATPLPPAPAPPPPSPTPPPFSSLFPPRARPVVRPAVIPPRPADIQVNDIEVTQGVQPQRTAVPTGNPGAVRGRVYLPFDPATRSGEVTLIADRPTVVRVYANLRSGPARGVPAPPAVLEGWRLGARVGQIAPEAAPRLLRPGPARVETGDRLQPREGVYTFRLPPSWTVGGSINLIARVNPAGLGCDAACRARSSAYLAGVGFVADRAGVVIRPFPLTDRGLLPRLGAVGDRPSSRPTVTDPRELFERTLAVTPRTVGVTGWGPPLEVGDLIRANALRVRTCILVCISSTVRSTDADRWRPLLQGRLFALMERHARGLRGARNHLPLGMVEQVANPLPGAMRGRVASGDAFGYARVNSPYRTIPHEVQHALGRPHASPGCDATGAQAGEPWPPDESGLLQGVGLDLRRGSGGTRGPYRTILPFTRDLMSYCRPPRESDGWISPWGWQTIVRSAGLDRPSRAFAREVARGHQAGPALLVTGIEFPDGQLAVLDTAPVRGTGPPGDPASPYVLESRDADGRVLAAQRVAARAPDHDDGVLLSAAVGAPPGTDHVVLRRGGEAAADVGRSPEAPRVRLLAPRPRTAIAGRELVVRYRATDADGDVLTATIEYSATDGRTWRVAHTGSATGTARIPRAALAGSRDARVRVRVDDGFSQATATSGRLQVAAPRPQVRIEPAPRTLPAGVPLLLEGSAAGVGGEILPARSLRWRAGGRVVGRGRSLTLGGLPPGRHRISLAATQAGAAGEAAVVVRVTPTRPAFLRLDAPARLPRGATSLRMRVASSLPATLRVTGPAVQGPRRGVPVTTRPRLVTIRVRPGTTTLRPVLTLAAGGRSARQPIIVRRT